jgi:hypothetical protein
MLKAVFALRLGRPAQFVRLLFLGAAFLAAAAPGPAPINDGASLRAAIAAAHAAGGGTVRLPAGVIALTEPIRLPGGVSLCGQGVKDTRLLAPGAMPAILVGFPEQAGLDLDRPDAAGVVAVPGWRGFTTAQRRFLRCDYGPVWGQWIGPPQLWDCWTKTSCLTIDVRLRKNGNWVAEAPIVGQGEEQPRPWRLCANWDDPTKLTLRIASSAVPDEWQGSDLDITWDLPANPLIDLALMVDLAGRRVQVAQNRIVVPVEVAWPALIGSHLRRCVDWPLVVGVSGMPANATVPTPMTLWGLHLDAGCRYTWATPGAPLARADGTPPTDPWRFSAIESTTIGWFDGRSAVGPYVGLSIGPTGEQGCWHVMGRDTVDPQPTILSGLRIDSAGPGIQASHALDLTCRDVTIAAHAQAVQLGLGWPVYPALIDHCHLGGGMLGLQVQSGCSIAVRSTVFAAQQPLLARYAGSLSVTDCFCAGSAAWFAPAVEILPGGSDAETIRLTDLVVDNENNPANWPIVQASREGTKPLTVVIDGLNAAHTAPAPRIRCIGAPAGAACKLRLPGEINPGVVPSGVEVGQGWSLSQ